MVIIKVESVVMLVEVMVVLVVVVMMVLVEVMVALEVMNEVVVVDCGGHSGDGGVSHGMRGTGGSVAVDVGRW